MNGKDRGESIAHRVVTAVGQANGTDPIELRPLAEVVDPDALNQLFETHGDGEIEVQFQYEGQTIFINHTGKVSLQPVDE